MHYRPHIIAHHQLGIKRIKHAVLMAKCYYNDTYNSETLGVYRLASCKRLKLICVLLMLFCSCKKDTPIDTTLVYTITFESQNAKYVVTPNNKREVTVIGKTYSNIYKCKSNEKIRIMASYENKQGYDVTVLATVNNTILVNETRPNMVDVEFVIPVL